VTSVVIADDQDLVRSGLRLLLEARGIEVRGEAGDGRQAIAEVARTAPDVALLDIRMPRLDGIAATREITRSTPGTRVLILTTYDLDEYVYHALRAGACGFLLKATPPDALAAGVRTVAAGEALLAPALIRRLIEEHISRPPVSAHPAAVAPGAGRVAADRPWAVQRGDREGAAPEPGDGEDARQPAAHQAGCGQPGAGRRAGVRVRSGPSWRRLAPGRALYGRRADKTTTRAAAPGSCIDRRSSHKATLRRGRRCADRRVQAGPPSVRAQ
jgi:DNA-binding NarL/FixJ family response regulator